MDENQRHLARLELIRTFPGSEDILGDLLGIPEALGAANNLDRPRIRQLEDEDIPRSTGVTYHDRLVLYNQLYETARGLYPNAIPRQVAAARRRQHSQSGLQQDLARTTNPPSEMPNLIIIALILYIHSIPFF